MSGSNHDVRVERGRTWTLNLTWMSESAPQDLTGWSGTLAVRETYTDPIVISKGAVVGGPAGTISFSMTPAETQALVAGSYLYDVKMVSPANQALTLIRGRFAVIPTVTP